MGSTLWGSDIITIPPCTVHESGLQSVFFFFQLHFLFLDLTFEKRIYFILFENKLRISITFKQIFWLISTGKYFRVEKKNLKKRCLCETSNSAKIFFLFCLYILYIYYIYLYILYIFCFRQIWPRSTSTLLSNPTYFDSWFDFGQLGIKKPVCRLKKLDEFKKFIKSVKYFFFKENYSRVQECTLKEF